MARLSALDLVLDLALSRSVVVRDMERRLASHGLGLSDLALLLELSSAPDQRLRRADLAERLGVTTSGVARQLHPLERMGLVDREAVAKDARMSLVLLTEAGAETVEDVRPDAEARAAEVLSRRWSDAEQRQAANLLARFRN